MIKREWQWGSDYIHLIFKAVRQLKNFGLYRIVKKKKRKKERKMLISIWNALVWLLL